MKKFKTKPVIKEAFQFNGNLSDLDLKKISPGREIQGVVWKDADGKTGSHLLIKTLEGTMRADPGDWIIKGLGGEFYPCKPDIFEKTYDPV